MGVDPTGAPVDVVIAVWPWDAYLGADALENGVAVGLSLIHISALRRDKRY